MLEFIARFFGLPVLGSQHGLDVDRLLALLHILMVVLFIGWGSYFLYTLWRFRERRTAAADHVGARTHISKYAEIGVALFEFTLLFGMAIPFWARAVDKFPDEKDATVMRIIGRQFNWIARYPGPDGQFGAARLDLVSADNPLGLDKEDPAGKDDITTGVDEMAVPLGKPVIAYISSLDVIHSFKVTPLRVTQDATPGLSVPIHFNPTTTNTYQIQCSQLCGNGHYAMRGIFKVLGPDEYKTWVDARAKAAGAANYE